MESINSSKMDNSWVLTMMDLVLLMICFFVMIFSLSKIEKDEQKEILKQNFVIKSKFISSHKGWSSSNLLYKNINSLIKNSDITLEKAIEEDISFVKMNIPNNYLLSNGILDLENLIIPVLFHQKINSIKIKINYLDIKNIDINNLIDNNLSKLPNTPIKKDYDVIYYCKKLQDILSERLRIEDVSIVINTKINNDNDINTNIISLEIYTE